MFVLCENVNQQKLPKHQEHTDIFVPCHVVTINTQYPTVPLVNLKLYGNCNSVSCLFS